MSRQTAETLLLSAMINTRDATAHKDYGVSSEHFGGYRSEFDWIVSYHERFGTCPSKEELAVQFPDFPLVADQDEVRWPSVEVIREYSARKMAKALLRASADLKNNNIEEAYGRLEGLRLNTVAEKPRNMLVDHSFLDDYDEPLDKVEVPWRTLQRHTNGIGKSELWYMAARPGNGKTSTMLDIAVRAALGGHRVAVYSLEMSKRNIQTKAHTIMAYEMGIHVSQREMASRTFSKLEYKALLQKIEAKMEQTQGLLHIHTPTDGPTTPAVINAHAREYDLIAIDYVGLMHADGGEQAVDDWRVIARISNALKATALRHNVAILAASQINREGDNAEKRPPRLKHLSQSDALGQDGDVVITMAQMAKDAQAYSLEKNRHGEGGYRWYTNFQPDTGNFTEITREKAQALRDNTDPFED